MGSIEVTASDGVKALKGYGVNIDVFGNGAGWVVSSAIGFPLRQYAYSQHILHGSNTQLRNPDRYAFQTLPKASHQENIRKRIMESKSLLVSLSTGPKPSRNFPTNIRKRSCHRCSTLQRRAMQIRREKRRPRTHEERFQC